MTKIDFLKTLQSPDYDLLESSSMYSFLHENQGHMWSSVDGEGGGPQVLEFSFENGAPNLEEFNVSRQTVRNWARQKMMGVSITGTVLKRYFDSAGWKQGRHWKSLAVIVTHL